MKKLSTILLVVAVVFSLTQTAEAAKQNILIESFTATWCGPCGSYGKPATKEIEDTWGDNVFVTELHAGNDPYNIPEYSSIGGAFGLGGVPYGMLNRNAFNVGGETSFMIYPTSWKQVIPQMLENNAPVSVSVFYSIDESSRQVSATVSCEFDEAMTSPEGFAFNLYVNESNLVYMQNGQGDSYNHTNVCRKVVGGPFGTNGVIPSSVSAGDMFSHTYDFTLDASWKIDDLDFIATVAEYSTSDGNYVQILNAGKGTIGQPSSSLEVTGSLFSMVESGNSFDKEFTLTNLRNESMIFEISLDKSARTPADWAGAVVIPAGMQGKLDKVNADLYEVELDAGANATITLSLTPGEVGIGDVSMTIYDKWDEEGQKSKGAITALSAEAQNFQIAAYKDDQYSLKSYMATAGISNVVDMTAEEYDSYSYLLDDVKFLVWNVGEGGALTGGDASNITQAIGAGANAFIVGANLHNVQEDCASLMNYIGVRYAGICWQGRNTEGRINLKGYDNDPISAGFNQQCQLINLVTPALKVADDTKATPFLRHTSVDTVVAFRSVVNERKVVYMGINPYIITNTNARDDLMNKAFEWLQGVGPAIECAQSMNFEETELGKSSETILTITNPGKSDLNVSNVEVNYDYSHIFKVVGETSFTVTPEGTYDLTIEFAPAYALEYSSYLDIVSNAENSSQMRVNLIGTGKEPSSVSDTEMGDKLFGLTVGPNPISTEAKVTFTLNNAINSEVELTLVDALGNTVQTIANKSFAAGTYNFDINAANVASGKYMLVARTNGALKQTPVIVTK